MRSILLPSRLTLAACIVAVGLCASTGSASAAGCAAGYSGLTHNVIIQSCIADPDAPVYATISRTAAGEILLDGNAIAGGPTVLNTNAIVYQGDGGDADEITLDMSNGRFAPGFTPEPAGLKSAIEIDIDGGAGATDFLTILGMDGAVGDRFEVGDDGIDLDDDGDGDIDYVNVTGRLTVDAQGGDDHLYGVGFESSSPGSAPLTFRGGPGDDQITGGAGPDELDGGAGVDWLWEYGDRGFNLTDTTLTGNGADDLSGFEHARLGGDSGPQTIDASAFHGDVQLDGHGGSDTLIGGPLGDLFWPGDGDDTIVGGPGSDQVQQILSGPAVLTDTTLTGLGTDTLESVEQAYLIGTQGSDTMDASAFSGNARLVGFEGSDVLIAGAGGSQLVGGADGDELVGGPGVDSFQGEAGDDRIFSRDARTEQVSCGEGADTVTADGLDGLYGCEAIDRGGAPAQPDGAAGSGPDAGGTAADALAPTLSGLALSRHRFRAASSGAAIAASAVGTTVGFTLSESATVTFRIQRAMPGRGAGGRCRAPSSRNRSRPACTRWVSLRGALTHAGLAGQNKLVLRGRLGGRALAPGRYRLVVSAADSAANRSTLSRAGFRIVAG